jgi:hypothetical protein
MLNLTTSRNLILILEVRWSETRVSTTPRPHLEPPRRESGEPLSKTSHVSIRVRIRS